MQRQEGRAVHYMIEAVSSLVGGEGEVREAEPDEDGLPGPSYNLFYILSAVGKQ